MKRLFTDKYFIGFLLIYIMSVLALSIIFEKPLSESTGILLVYGIGFPMIAWLLTRRSSPSHPDKPTFKNEIVFIASLVLWFLWYVTYGTGWLNSLMPALIMSSGWKSECFVLIKKLFVFVLVPFSLYKAAGFELKDFGFTINRSAAKSSLLIFIVLSALAVAMQFFLGKGGVPFLKGAYSSKQLLLGLPLCFLWYFIEVGLVEEFFFRAFLQSRLTVLLRSRTAGIVISCLIFGLAHAPGLYLRGAESEGVTEQLPFMFWAAYTISVMSLAGIFLGLIWSRTKNIWLLMGIHAMVDLIPNFADFIKNWNL